MKFYEIQHSYTSTLLQVSRHFTKVVDRYPSDSLSKCSLPATTCSRSSNMSPILSASASVPAAIPLLGGGDISKLLKSEGPVVTAVLLKAGPDAVVEQVQVDTTPQKQMVHKILGGPFTFLGQYEEEGTMLMCLRDDNNDNLTINQHKLQPPFDQTRVRGDILLLRVAAEDDTDETDCPVDTLSSKSNEEFFLNYTKDEYVKFAARTDVEGPKAVASEEVDEEDDIESDDEEEDEEIEGESDEEDDDAAGFMELLMGQVMQRFQQEHGRLPDEKEMQALQSAIAEKMG